MLTVKTIPELRHWIARQRGHHRRIALVPTMGALHQAHLRLVDVAHEHADCVVASIFVNPLQFGAGEDFEAYPRVLSDDAGLLESRGTHLLFAPQVTEVYPHGAQCAARVDVPVLSTILCGAVRPGHFSGVATVVTKLFNLVQPHVAVFGQKDYQQLAVIRCLTDELNFPVEIVGVPTVRDADGLAMSSRNRYLSTQERARAPVLYALLQQVAQRLREGAGNLVDLQQEATKRLEQAGFRPEYVSIRRAVDLAEPVSTDAALVVLAAAWLGRARLIDNLVVERVKPKSGT